MKLKTLVLLNVTLTGLCFFAFLSARANPSLAITVKGKITKPDGERARDGLTVEVTISSKQISNTGITELKADGDNYALTLIGPFMNEAKWPAAGDEIELVVKEEEGEVLGKISHIITAEEDEAGFISLDFRLNNSGLFPFDLNKDGKIDIFDLVIVGKNFGKQDATPEQGDVNDDGVANIFDLVMVAGHFGETVPVAPLSFVNRKFEVVETRLLQNYPNPFNPETWIPFKLAEPANVVISIYDVSGQLVRKLELDDIPAGVYVTKDKAAYWDGRDSFGQKVSSGVYYYILQADNFSATRRMLILK